MTQQNMDIAKERHLTTGKYSFYYVSKKYSKYKNVANFCFAYTMIASVC